MTMHLVELDQLPIFEQLQLEEALLRADQRNWCLINVGSPPAIVMGISGKLEQLVHDQTWAQAPIPIIRRFSGGGTVVVDENTFFATFICNSSFISIPPYPDPIMRWTAELYRPFFSAAFDLKENDYTLHHYKFGGNAQSICKNRWLHHSSLLWDYTPAYMNYLLQPPRMPAYRLQRAHTDFLYPLRHDWPNKQTFKEKLVQHFKNHLPIQEVKQEEVEKILQLPHRKATSRVK